jgi:hypothetical protein
MATPLLKNLGKKDIGTSVTNLYTAPSANGTIFLDFRVTNTTAGTIQINIQQLLTATGDTIYLIKSVPIVPGGTFVFVGNGGGANGAARCLVLSQNDVLKINSDTATSCDVSGTYYDM